MGSRLVIHSQPKIGWHGIRQAYFEAGLRARGIDYVVTDSRVRTDDAPALLLGTSLWRQVEATGQYLLVDRCSFGETNKFVSLVWNGHGRRGEHRIANPCDASRWEAIGMDLDPWRQGGTRVVLCGQTEAYSPHYSTPDEWYYSVNATHFRPHPAGPQFGPYPLDSTLEDCRLAVTLNSSVAVKTVMQGIPTVTMDGGSMAWDVTGHSPEEVVRPDRLPWCHWLAWTQWSDDEIKEGIVWDSLW